MINCRTVGLASIGAYAPEKKLTNADLEKMVETTDEWITTRTGIKERRVAAPEQASSDIAVGAARKAIERADIDPSSIDMIIACTATPDYQFPATACLVQEKLGIRNNCAGFDLQAGCTGFLYGMAVGSQFVAAGSCNNVLVVGAEVLTRILNWEDRNTCVLFGDGAGAAILQPTSKDQGIIGFELNSSGAFGDILSLPAGGSKSPTSEETVREKLHNVHMDGREVFRHAITVMSESAQTLLKKNNVKISDIDWYIPHQANIRIIESTSKKLGIPMDKVITNLARYGNTSCGSIPIAMNEGFEQGKIKKGDLLLITAVGAGLTWGSMLFRWGI